MRARYSPPPHTHSLLLAVYVDFPPPRHSGPSPPRNSQSPCVPPTACHCTHTHRPSQPPPARQSSSSPRPRTRAGRGRRHQTGSRPACMCVRQVAVCMGKVCVGASGRGAGGNCTCPAAPSRPQRRAAIAPAPRHAITTTLQPHAPTDFARPTHTPVTPLTHHHLPP